jgi:hypothetical protein
MNTGGHFGHLGGALMGYLYIDQLRKGNDLAGWVDNLMWWKWTSKKRKLKVVHRSERPQAAVVSKEEELDRILDKIKVDGLGSLSDVEKEFLKKMSES